MKRKKKKKKHKRVGVTDFIPLLPSERAGGGPDFPGELHVWFEDEEDEDEGG